jgi:hypothetical protein
MGRIAQEGCPSGASGGKQVRRGWSSSMTCALQPYSPGSDGSMKAWGVKREGSREKWQVGKD